MNNIFDDTISLKNISCNYAARKEKLKVVEHTSYNPIRSRLLTKLFIREQLKENAVTVGNIIKEVAISLGTQTNQLTELTINKIINKTKNVKHNKERKEENKTSSHQENQ